MAFPAILAPLIKPFLTGAATGGVLGFATGKDPLKSALMGGVMGGIGSKIAGAEAVSGVGSSTGGVSGVGTVPVNSGSFMPPTMPETGMFNAFNTATNAPTGFAVTEAATQAANPLIAGGASAGGLSIDPAASGFSRFLDGLPDYVTPENVLGAANILSQSQPQQMPMPTSSASVSRGKPRQGAIDYGMAQPIRRRGLL
jgi:hypothetical protein